MKAGALPLPPMRAALYGGCGSSWAGGGGWGAHEARGVEALPAKVTVIGHVAAPNAAGVRRLEGASWVEGKRRDCKR